jgi:hypothetical protein
MSTEETRLRTALRTVTADRDLWRKRCMEQVDKVRALEKQLRDQRMLASAALEKSATRQRRRELDN